MHVQYTLSKNTVQVVEQDRTYQLVRSPLHEPELGATLLQLLESGARGISHSSFHNIMPVAVATCTVY